MLQHRLREDRRNTYHGESGNNRIQVNTRLGNKEHEKLTSKKKGWIQSPKIKKWQETVQILRKNSSLAHFVGVAYHLLPSQCIPVIPFNLLRVLLHYIHESCLCGLLLFLLPDSSILSILCSVLLLMKILKSLTCQDLPSVFLSVPSPNHNTNINWGPGSYAAIFYSVWSHYTTCPIHPFTRGHSI